MNRIKPVIFILGLVSFFTDLSSGGAPRDALLADATTKEERGKAFGFRRSMDALGAALGPLVAFGILTGFHGSYSTVFWASAIPGVIATILLVFFLKENRTPKEAEHQRRRLSFGFKGMNPRFMWFTMVSTLFAIGNFSDAFLILRAKNVGMSTIWIPLAYLTFNLVASIFSIPAGILSDKMGRRPVLVVGYLIFAVIYLGFGVANHVVWIWILFILYGLYYAATEGIQKAYIADIVSVGQRGTAMGTYNALTGLVALPASIIAGYLWESFSPIMTFGVSAILSLLAALLMVIFRI